ncbi:MAG: MobF family relaxase [Acidimicrobiales bacterium]
MLSVAKIGAGQAEYYLATVLSEEGAARGSLIEPDGYWMGSACGRLGLSGAAEPRAVRRLLGGRDPTGGEHLLDGAVRARRFVAAYDCTFSVPKSVSILEALGDPAHGTEVRAAHARSVEAAVGYLEQSSARLRRSSPDGRRSLEADGVVAAAFVHRSSRAPDPHLHTHVLIANLAVDPAGRWQSLDARRLYTELQTASHLCEAHLRAQLSSSLGVAWGEMRGAYADLLGIGEEAVRAYSRRSKAIVQLLADAGLDRGDPRAADLVRAARPPKDVGVAHEELVDAWRERSWRLGISAGALSDVGGRRGANEPPAVARDWQEKTLAEVSSMSKERSFGRRHLLRARCRTAGDGRCAEDVVRDVDELLSSGRVVARGGAVSFLPAAGGRGYMPVGEIEPRFVTHESLAAEERILAAVAAAPEAVTVVAYEQGGRLGALDALFELAHPCPPASGAAAAATASALAPGRNAALVFEGLTGIETFPSPAMLAGSPNAGVLIVADAHRLSTPELEAVAGNARLGWREVVLLLPRPALDRDELLGRVANAATIQLVGAPAVQVYERGGVDLTRASGEELELGGVSVLATSSPGMARRAALERAAQTGATLVAGDETVVAALRRTSPLQAAGEVRVVTPGELRRALRRAPGDAAVVKPRSVVVLGGAAELRLGAEALDRVERCHVLVAPGARMSVAADRARIAEAVQPAYMRSELGPRRLDPIERAAWRSGAELVEAFRNEFGVENSRHAFGTPGQQRSAPAPRRIAAETVHLGLSDVAATLDRSCRRGRGLGLDGPGGR